MAILFSTFIRSIKSAPLWSIFQSFFQGGLHENDNTCQKTPNTESSEAQAESQPAATCDLESGLHVNVPADDNITPPSSPAPHSGQNAPLTQEGLNPVAKIFKQDLGKTIIGLVVPLTGAFLTPYAPTSLLVRILVLLSLSMGFALLWNGILLRYISPSYANILEQIGAALVILAVYGLISSFLPNYLLWIPWASFLMVLLPIFQGGLHENHTCQKTPNTESSGAQAGPQPAMCDLESGLHVNVPAENIRPPSSPAPYSGENAPPTREELNPIAKIFKEQDLGKTIIGFVVPLTGAFLTPYAPTSLLVRILVLLSLSIGFPLLWNGILLRYISPRYSNIMEQIGAVLVILAVYGLISSFLPNYLLWIPWASFLMVLLPIFWCYFWASRPI